MARSRKLLPFVTLAAGAVVGAVAEEVLYRRAFAAPDPEADEPIGSVPGRTSWVESFDGTKLYTRSYGPKDPDAWIVFAHGVVENHVIWHYQVRDLREDGRYGLVAYDARGHANSGPARGPHGTTPFDGDTLGKDLAAVVAQATSGQVVLVGHSLGGMTALTQLVLDRKERERVAGAVIVNSTFTAELAGWRGHGGIFQRAFEAAGDVARRFIGADAKRLDRLRTGANDLAFFFARAIYGDNPSQRHIAVGVHMFETTPSQTLAAGADLITFDVYEDLEKIDIPVLIVAGSKDIMTPMFLSEEMADVIGDAELVVLEGCGHNAPFERYADLTSHIRKFADAVTS